MRSRPGRVGSGPTFSRRTQSPAFRSSTRTVPVVTGGGGASVVVSRGDGRAVVDGVIVVVVVVDGVADAELVSEGAVAATMISTSAATRLTAYDAVSPTSARSR